MRMNHLQRLLAKRQVLILDGGFATELERYGLDLNHELWSARALIEHPDLVRQVHTDYLNAGADLILSGTYQASVAGFMRYGLDKPAALATLEKGVGLAMEARNNWIADRPSLEDTPLVGASVGPYGAYLANGAEYTGNYPVNKAALYHFHEERLCAFLAASPDFLAFETCPNVVETAVYLELLEKYKDIPALLSWSCSTADTLVSGEPLLEALRLADQSDAVLAVGVNCCNADLAGQVLANMANHTQKPLLAYPNRGESWDSTNKCWIDQHKAVNLAETVIGWVKQGPIIVGGCCRTDPAFIAQLAAELKTL